MSTLRERWLDDERLFGVWCTMPGSVQAEMIARQGLDYVCIDYQHGMIDHGDGVPMAQGILAGGSRPIARPAWNEPARIMQVLDAGVDAVVVPMVNTVAEAEAAVSATRYPPRGTRSYGPVRAREIFSTADPEALEQVAVLTMVETRQGIANAEEIINVEGATGVYIGPSDLSLAMGLTPNVFPHADEMVEFLRFVVDRCNHAGRVPGIQAANGEIAAFYGDLGFRMITIASDSPLLTSAVRTTLGVSRGGAAASRETVSNY
jgi:4-hydroxy-2-oxoheptanedioate aldolase